MKRIIIFITICTLLFGLTSCNDFLDVRPKSQIPADLQFNSDAGFFDQLIGVYTKMSEGAMYGREMTFGLIEVLSQNYDLGATNAYQYAAEYDYMHSSVRGRIDGIWRNTYNCIAGLNLMLAYLEKADPDIFRDNNRSVYKGEALGLRAFLHFDLLRIFAPGYAANSGAMSIPYVTEYGPIITPQSTVNQIIDLIIQDLEEAATLLENTDPLIGGISGTQYQNWYRRAYFNYYAAVATLARVYLYKGDKVNALRYAEYVIYERGDAYRWTHFSSKDASNPLQCDRLFTPEMIFYLKIADMANLINPWFTRNSTTVLTNPNALNPNEAKEDVIFEVNSGGHGNDYRRANCFSFDGSSKYLSKFWQYNGGSYNNYFPLIRMTEAYYIAAEIVKDIDPDRAISLLNIVRDERRILPLPLSYWEEMIITPPAEEGGVADTTVVRHPQPTLTVEQIQDEIFKEYRKEFIGEGQLFFYYKRRNLPNIEFTPVPADNRSYVLPLPDNEVDFGFRQ